NQGCGVDDFYDRAETDSALPLIAAQLCREQQNGRTNTLPTALAQIFANFSDYLYVGNRVPLKLALNGEQIVTQQIEDFLCSESIAPKLAGSDCRCCH